MKKTRFVLLALLLSLLSPGKSAAQVAPTPPAITNMVATTNGMQILSFTPYPAADIFNMQRTSDMGIPFQNDTNGIFSGLNWTFTNIVGTNAFFRLAVTPLSSNALLTAIVLNRLAYGPTPDELERVLTGTNPIGAQGYINEQLAPENIQEIVENTHTNVLFIEGKLLGPTNLLQRMITSNILYASTNFTVTNTITVVSNNGVQLVTLSTFTTNYTTNAATVVGFTNITIASAAATIGDFRALHTQRAVGAKRQLLEVLLQFLENHFVTQYTKSSTYLNGFYNGDANVAEDRIATQWEFLENDRWRNALLNPNCTFYDLLKISAESPAMIVYLDTVTSLGSGSKVANENYARELLELFTFGVDNGYDQTDITIMSRAWTGWTVEFVHPTNAFNPFALKTTTKINPAGSTFDTNLLGVWAFNFKSNNHTTTNILGPIFPGKTVPARFGPPWAGQSYQLNMSIPARKGTNGIQDAYDVINHLAVQPFAEEFISVKLCRLFVHDNFHHGVYDYTDPNLSPEGQLVHQCMLAWETPGPDGRKGNIRAILNTIFSSDLFRGNGAAFQKVKTPLEYVVSAVRALRSSTNHTDSAGSYTAQTDGYAFANPLSRTGGMLLFDRNDPNGYPEDGPGWISGGTLAERIRFVQSFCTANGVSGHTGSTNDAGNCISDPVSLLKFKLPNSSWTNATNVASYFVGILYPGEGRANLNLYTTAALNFLNDGTGDPTPSTNKFSVLAVSNAANTAYDNRVRGMVGMLMSLQRFQEQ